MKLMTRGAAASIAVLTLLAIALPAAAQAARVETGSMQLGLQVDPGAIGFVGPPTLPASNLAEGEKVGTWIRLEVGWDEIETRPGIYDWSLIADRVAAMREKRYRVALVLHGSHPTYLPDGGEPRADAAGSIEAWTRFLRSAVRSFSGEVEQFQVGRTLQPDSAVGYAFLLKNSALALRAEARLEGIEIQVAQAAVPIGLEAEQAKIWSRGAAAYVDVLPVMVSATEGDVAGPLTRMLAENVRNPPASEVWAIVDAAPGRPEGLRGAAAIQALASGAAAAMLASNEGESRLPEIGSWVNRTRRLLADGYAPAPLGKVRVETGGGEAIDGARPLGRFFSDADFSTLVFYSAPGETIDLPDDRIVVDTRLVREAYWNELVNGRTLRVATGEADGGATRTIRAGRSPYPSAIRFLQGAPGGLDLPPEAVETTGTRDLTADEVIARHQQVSKNQSDRLERWIARGRVDLHFKLAQGGSSIDLSIESNYFWEEGKPLEYEQTDYFINGNKVRWKKIPELPLIQPEKVITLPLDLTLDKTYTYRSAGRDKVEGRDTYVLQFQPGDPDAPLSLYRGRVWIDAESFVLLKSSVIQTGLEAPVLSNEEIDAFRPQTGPDGTEYWLLDDVTGQQTWSATGRTFVVQREVTFLSYEINPPIDAFEAKKQAAYASTNQMLRDTDDGFRYLEPTDDGGRRVKEGVDTSQLFAAAGVLRDAGTGSVIPLGGVNYFNYDLGGRNIQTNVFFAGAFAFATASKPDLFGKKIDLTADLTLWGIKRDDEFFVDGEEVEAQAVSERPASLSVRLGFPVRNFLKLNLIAGATHRSYDRSSDTRLAIEAYNVANPGQSIRPVLPEDHLETSGTLAFDFNRRGYAFSGAASSFSRSDWAENGLFDDTAQTFLVFDPVGDTFVAGAPEAVQDSFSRWKLNASKEWYLPKFQKIRAGVDWLDGEDMDRFSKYRFSFFGDDSLSGFSNSGVRFDEGTIGRLGYSFNLFEVLRFDLALEQARVRETLIGGPRQEFTGVGLSANFVGPWKTVFNINYGYALESDIEALEGEQEFLIVVFKLF